MRGGADEGEEMKDFDQDEVQEWVARVEKEEGQ